MSAPERLMRVAPTEVSFKLPVQLRLHQHHVPTIGVGSLTLMEQTDLLSHDRGVKH
ncbi:hypothetical protein SynWH8103_01772 [Synechococcus sp. WH 8103]|nr:hypothetical protein SynWH8103_01772 [Synechococcus sp. WH 8103]